MALSKCIRRCWDSQLKRRYWPGDIDEISEDHVFLTGKTKCFELVDEKKMGPMKRGRGNPNWIKK